MFVFEPEGSWCFPAGRPENLSSNFRLPALFSALAAPMKLDTEILYILSRSLLETEIR